MNIKHNIFQRDYNKNKLIKLSAKKCYTTANSHNNLLLNFKPMPISTLPRTTTILSLKNIANSIWAIFTTNIINSTI